MPVITALITSAAAVVTNSVRPSASMPAPISAITTTSIGDNPEIAPR